MLTHRNLVSNAKATYKHLVVGESVVGPDDTFLSFLPLAHSFERMIHLLALAAGSTVVYSHGVRTLMDEMATQKPTIMGCVPRVYESIQEKLMETAAKGPEKNRKLFEETIAVGKKMLEYRQAGKVPGIVTSIKHMVLDKLVAEKVRQKFGGQWRIWISGGAALNPDTARFFIALGFNLLEGYGLTETSPVISVNPIGKQKIGTVGTVIEGGEIMIAADGEICYRGANVMKGYFNNPQATGDMIDSHGWLHTGDIGTYEDGYLKITDRKKDIIVLANGKNVSPTPIESSIKESPFIQEIVLLGDKQNVCSALVIPNVDRCIAWAKEQGFDLADGDAVIASTEIKKLIKSEIDKYSTWLADFEKIRRFTLLNTTFSIDGGELTPTMKVKRRVINQKFAAEISALFGDAS
jgi:long-chain acyl-CoA synthetase